MWGIYLGARVVDRLQLLPGISAPQDSVSRVHLPNSHEKKTKYQIMKMIKTNTKMHMVYRHHKTRWGTKGEDCIYKIYMQIYKIWI